MLTFLFIGSLAATVQDSRPAPKIGSRISRPAYEEQQVEQASRVEAFRILQRVGDCLVKYDARRSTALLTTDPGTPGGGKALDTLRPRMSDCLGTAVSGSRLYGNLTLKMSETALRGAIAGALYRRHFLARPPASLRKPAGVSPILPLQQSDPRAGMMVLGYGFAQCLTQANPAAVRELVLSKIGSREETAALSQLTPAMPSCASIGMTIKTDRNSLRLMLADSLYRWSVTAAGTS